MLNGFMVNLVNPGRILYGFL